MNEKMLKKVLHTRFIQLHAFYDNWSDRPIEGRILCLDGIAPGVWPWRFYDMKIINFHFQKTLLAGYRARGRQDFTG